MFEHVLNQLIHDANSQSSPHKADSDADSRDPTKNGTIDSRITLLRGELVCQVPY